MHFTAEDRASWIKSVGMGRNRLKPDLVISSQWSYTQENPYENGDLTNGNRDLRWFKMICHGIPSQNNHNPIWLGGTKTFRDDSYITVRCLISAKFSRRFKVSWQAPGTGGAVGQGPCHAKRHQLVAFKGFVEASCLRRRLTNSQMHASESCVAPNLLVSLKSIHRRIWEDSSGQENVTHFLGS